MRIDVPEGQGIAFIEYDDKRDADDAAKDMSGKKVGGDIIHASIATSATGHGGMPGVRTMDITERIAELARVYRLDEAATARLASVFSERSRLGCDINRDLADLGDHLAASNKPSALVSMKLADLRAGKPIGPCRYTGSSRDKGGGPGPGTFAAAEAGWSGQLHRECGERGSERGSERGADRGAERGAERLRRSDRSRSRRGDRRAEGKRREEGGDRDRAREKEGGDRERPSDRSREKEGARSRDKERDRDRDREKEKSKERRREKSEDGDLTEGKPSLRGSREALTSRSRQRDKKRSRSKCSSDGGSH